MKKLNFVLLFFFTVILLSSCRNKTVLLLTKKWDCVQVENIVPPGTRFLSASDSTNAEQLKALLQSISWTFKKNMRYECAVNSRITVEGKYALLEKDKILECTPDSKNNTNRYNIKSITENELILSGRAENADIIMHFKPH